MKKTLLIFFLLAPVIGFSQDALRCKITFVNENNIFFDYRPIPTKNKIVSTNILRSSVTGFTMPVQFQTANIQVDSLNADRSIPATLAPNTLAGNELIISANSMFTAMGIYGGSILISIIGVATLVPPFYIIGGIGSIVAIIFYIKSWTHINKAGIILKKNRL